MAIPYGIPLHFDPYELPQVVDSDQVEPFELGILFQGLNADDNSETSIHSRHWALVLTEPNKSWSLQFELSKTGTTLSFPARLFNPSVEAFPLGIWKGTLRDITKLMQAHPMRFTTYSSSWNNCQHWAATMLILMEAIAIKKENEGMFFKISPAALTRHDRVKKVLDWQDDGQLYHVFNPVLDRANVAGLSSGSAIAAMSLTAANATTTVMTTATEVVPASGLWGWLGYTATNTVQVAEKVPAAYASLGAMALPVAVTGTALTAAYYIYNRVGRRGKTIFKDPRMSGVIPENTELLSDVERGLGFETVKSSISFQAPTCACSSSSGGVIDLASAGSALSQAASDAVAEAAKVCVDRNCKITVHCKCGKQVLLNSIPGG
ncbi:hypothetical protein TWF694_005115 [Orbilia ellipsospora]|uniref:Uncharacterized protein n=1 Tax=Orbilia ellipsospora TaxID=2528407 RepID=A0AAV9WUX7_9PEZI